VIPIATPLADEPFGVNRTAAQVERSESSEARDPPPAGDVSAGLRRICSTLPEVSERPSHGAPTWFVRDRKAFVTLWERGHHEHDFPHLWLAAPPGSQEELVAAAPQRYFRPPYVGGRGWG
jgi:hypothetical protein